MTNLCAYCFKPAVPPHMDHVVPISRGGPDDPTNKVMSCAACNLSKGARLPSEWLQSPPPLVAEIERNILLKVGNRDPRIKDRPLPATGTLGSIPLPSVAAVLEWQLGLSPAELKSALTALQAGLSKRHLVTGPGAADLLQNCASAAERHFLLGLFCRSDDRYTVEQHEEEPSILWCKCDGFKFRVTGGHDVDDDSWCCDCDDEACQHQPPKLGRLAFMLYAESLPGDDFDLWPHGCSIGVSLDQRRRSAAEWRALRSAVGIHEECTLVAFDAHEVVSSPSACFDEAVRELRGMHVRAGELYRAGYRARGQALQVVAPVAEAAE